MTVSYEISRQLVREIAHDRTRCIWCFRTVRRGHQAYDAARANSLNRTVARIVTPSSAPAPGTSTEYVPDTEIEGEYRPSQKRVVCECGRIDAPEGENRTKKELHLCIDRIAGWLDDRGVCHDTDAMHDVASLLMRYDRLAGLDEVVLAESIRHGIAAGDLDDTQATTRSGIPA